MLNYPFQRTGKKSTATRLSGIAVQRYSFFNKPNCLKKRKFPTRVVFFTKKCKEV